jgi:hypothetical protein
MSHKRPANANGGPYNLQPLHPNASLSRAADIVARVRISEVYRSLGGGELNHGRGSAFWRGGDGQNVSLDDSRGVWHDFVTDDGGGILDLVQRIRRESRADALRWCAEFASVPLDDRALSPGDRARWAVEKHAMERDLPEARYWRRTAVALSEATLDLEKVRLFDPTERPGDLAAIRDITGMLERLKALGDTALVQYYHEWRADCPEVTAAMVRYARDLDRAELAALGRYLGVPERTAAAAIREVIQ